MFQVKKCPYEYVTSNADLRFLGSYSSPPLFSPLAIISGAAAPTCFIVLLKKMAGTDVPKPVGDI
jgi:hypothetical protein